MRSEILETWRNSNGERAALVVLPSGKLVVRVRLDGKYRRCEVAGDFCLACSDRMPLFTKEIR